MCNHHTGYKTFLQVPVLGNSQVFQVFVGFFSINVVTMLVVSNEKIQELNWRIYLSPPMGAKDVSTFLYLTFWYFQMFLQADE